MLRALVYQAIPCYLKETKLYSTSKIARTAGLLYFIYVITSVIANLFGKFMFVEAPVAVNHIITHAFQFRIGFVINLFSVVFFVAAAWALYVLLKPVNEDLALLFLIFNLDGFAVWLFSSLCLFASLMTVNGAETHPRIPARSVAGACMDGKGVVTLSFTVIWIEKGGNIMNKDVACLTGGISAGCRAFLTESAPVGTFSSCTP